MATVGPELVARFDDVWWGSAGPVKCPALGVDAFLAAHQGLSDEVERGCRVSVRKRG